MLESKSVKTFLIVVLGVCAVALLGALVTAFSSSLDIFVNSVSYYGEVLSDSYGKSVVLFGGLLLGLVVLGATFAVLVFVCKKKAALCLSVSCLTAVVYAVVICVLAFTKIRVYEDGTLSQKDYAFFQAYLSQVLGVIVPMAIATAALIAYSKLGFNAKPSVCAEEGNAEPNGENV